MHHMSLQPSTVSDHAANCFMYSFLDNCFFILSDPFVTHFLNCPLICFHFLLGLHISLVFSKFWGSLQDLCKFLQALNPLKKLNKMAPFFMTAEKTWKDESNTVAKYSYTSQQIYILLANSSSNKMALLIVTTGKKMKILKVGRGRRHIAWTWKGSKHVNSWTWK